MVDDDCVGALLGDQHVVFTERNADFLGLEKLGQQGAIFEVYVEGRNLGDARYEEAPGVPLPGRTLLAGLRLTW